MRTIRTENEKLLVPSIQLPKRSIQSTTYRSQVELKVSRTYISFFLLFLECLKVYYYCYKPYTPLCSIDLSSFAGFIEKNAGQLHAIDTCCIKG